MLKIDWNNCCAVSGVSQQTDNTKKIIIAGDWAPNWDVRESPYGKLLAAEPERSYGGVLDILRQADLRVVNVECTINGKDPVVKSGPHVFADSSHLPHLQAGGFQVAVLANNHTFDYGFDGCEQTRKALDSIGIRCCGAGADASEAWTPLVYDLDGIKIGFVCFTEGHDMISATDEKPGVAGWDIPRARSVIRELKRSCDIVIVIPHGGVENVANSCKFCIDAYRELAEESPDAIVAHHPHVPQGMEMFNGVPIFYSLGNFFFHQNSAFYYRRLGYMVELEITRSGVCGFKLHPYLITDDGLSLLDGEERKEFYKLMRRLSQTFECDDPCEGFYGMLKYRWHNNPFGLFKCIEPYYESDPKWAAAMIRSRLLTLQHTGLFIPLCTRVIDGTIDDAPQWGFELEEEYFTRKF